MQEKLIVITGEKGIGKTSVCRAVCEKAREKGYEVAGIISPPVFNTKGRKIGYKAENVVTNDSWILAKCEIPKEVLGPTFGPYQFSHEGFRIAVQAMKNAIYRGYDLFVLDEIGPLEMIREDGFRPAVELLISHGFDNLLTVVRPSLVADVIDFLNASKAFIFEVQLENRDTLHERVMKEIIKA